MEQLKPIPLQEQIERLGEGRYALPDVPACIVRQMARCPLDSYLAGFPRETSRIRRILGLSQNKDDGTTYQEAAERIARLWEEGRHLSVERAVSILAVPLSKSFWERRRAHESNTKNIP